MNLKKELVSVGGSAPLDVPLSPGVRFGDLLFLSGQVSVDVSRNEPVEGTIEEETERALGNLRDLLAAGGSSLDCVIKTTVYLRDMRDYAGMNQVYRRYFAGVAPARSTIGGVTLARSYRVEIEAVAYRCDR